MKNVVTYSVWIICFKDSFLSPSVKGFHVPRLALVMAFTLARWDKSLKLYLPGAPSILHNPLLHHLCALALMI